MSLHRLLVVDDDPLSREFLTEAANSLGVRAEATGHPAQALERVREREYDAVLTDLRMPGMDGLELIRRLGEVAPGLPTVLVTAHGSVEAAVEAMRLGAADFLLKPVSPQTLSLVLERVAATRRLLAENEYLRHQAEQEAPQLIARSRALQDTLDSARRIAHSKGTVLITGESGTGKERVAHFIHQHSPRVQGPFIRVNCAALSESLLESELFGHERGAFTGAHRRREGRFELADGGTLLLDEIGEIPPALQAKLLRVLEEEEFERVGGTVTLRVDVRIIATTNRSLPDEVAAGRFREDLYYRLHVLPIHLEPLRRRSEDVLPLAEHFARHYARLHGAALRSIPEETRARLLAWNWPGNVRELENVIQRAIVLMRGECLTPDLLLFGPGDHSPSRPVALAPGAEGAGAPSEVASDPDDSLEVLRGVDLATLAPLLANRPLEALERETILATLDATEGNKTEAARRLGVTARTLSNKMKLWKSSGLLPAKESAR
jgi:DNA-binding NtrC family response regulator